MLKFMLDTDICIYTIKNKPAKVRTAFETHYGQICVSTITAMELIYGAERSAQVEHNLAIVEGFLARLEVLDFNQHAATHAGQLRAELGRQGQPIGAYDFLIAGHARSCGLILVTNNLREFERVPGLRVESWLG